MEDWFDRYKKIEFAPPPPGPDDGTVARNWHGNVIDGKEAALARQWNEKAATGAFDMWKYKKYRKEMTAFGLPGKNWNVGHIIPNEPGSKRDNGPEDHGWNLMALDAEDNRLISNNVVT